MLKYLKQEANMTRTENGAAAYKSTTSCCLDLFASIGALRYAQENEIITRFKRAYAEDSDLAMKILFFARDVRGGLGERRIFRIVLGYLARNEKSSVVRNMGNIPEYGRYDDILTLLDTPCKSAATGFIKSRLETDLAAMEAGAKVSLLAKWLPSVNTSSENAVRHANIIAGALGMNAAQYRKTLSKLRAYIKIIENNLRERDYTFDYSKQPSRAMMKYRKAFWRNDGKRYGEFLDKVRGGTAKLNTGAIMPYDIIVPALRENMGEDERKSLEAEWNALEDFTNNENAIVVADGSGSMYYSPNTSAPPAAVALSLAIYYAERNKGAFANHFITFSHSPQLVEIKGKDIYEKVKYCESFNEVADTNIEKVFRLILNTALKHKAAQSELPATIYIISDMEFNFCAKGADRTNFEAAKAMFAKKGYVLPKVVFWNVASRAQQLPVTKNEQGVALVSGCSPRLFSMVTAGEFSPYDYMMSVLEGERYKNIGA